MEPCRILVGIMWAVSLWLKMVVRAQARIILGVKARMEVDMKAIINLVCVVAGTALLGRSGDVFPTLQGKARVGLGLPFEIWE